MDARTPRKPPESGAEGRIDEALDESFPASDPPSWTADVEPGGPDHGKGRPKPPPAGPEKKREEPVEKSHTKGRPTPPPSGPSGRSED